MLSRVAAQALRRPVAMAAMASTSRLVASASLASTSASALSSRLYATAVVSRAKIAKEEQARAARLAEEQAMMPVAPSAKDETGVIMKRYVGKGFPNIPGLRHVVYPYHSHLFQGEPVRELTQARRRKGGRNASGQVTVKGIGGGHKQRLRIVDFYRLESGIHDVVRIEYDPGRSGHIALLHRRGAAHNAGTKGVHSEQFKWRVSPDQGAILAEKVSEAPGGSTESRIARNEVKGGWSYILAPDGLRAGDTVQSFRDGIPPGLVEGWETAMKEKKKAGSSANDGHSTAIRALGIMRTVTLKPGNVLPLSLIPAGTMIHNISLTPDGRMQLCRSAGTFGQVVAHHGPEGEALGGADVLHMDGVVNKEGVRVERQGSVLVRLQSGEVRRVQPSCVATIGVVSNKEHAQRQIGKAGRSRWLGKRPKVRGVVMNTCDHPHGGGRGKSKGNKHPRSQTNVLQGVRTRRPKDKNGNKNVVTQRPRGRASK